MTKPTKAQLRVLARIAESPNGTASRMLLATTETLLWRLENRKLIHSAQPFPSSYHTITLTETGRAALSDA